MLYLCVLRELKCPPGANIWGTSVKTPLGMPLSHSGVPEFKSQLQFPIHVDFGRRQVVAPVMGCWWDARLPVQPYLTPAVAGIWGVSQRKATLSLSVSLSLPLN